MTADGTHYAKIFVTGIDYVTPPEPFLEINYSDGRPGSFFTLSGYYFPPNSVATIIVNWSTLGTVTTDSTGLFDFLLNTAQATPGQYQVTASVNPSATVGFVLDPEAPLRIQEGEGETFNVPEGIALKNVYLPIMQR